MFAGWTRNRKSISEKRGGGDIIPQFLGWQNKAQLVRFSCFGVCSAQLVLLYDPSWCPALWCHIQPERQQQNIRIYLLQNINNNICIDAQLLSIRYLLESHGGVGCASGEDQQRNMGVPSAQLDGDALERRHCPFVEVGLRNKIAHGFKYLQHIRPSCCEKRKIKNLHQTCRVA